MSLSSQSLPVHITPFSNSFWTFCLHLTMSSSFGEPGALVYKSHVPLLPLVLNWKVDRVRVMSSFSSVSLHYRSGPEIFKPCSMSKLK